ncbi:MAG: hypothetical protein KDD42_00300 [Bdellovibrionales bacterium]|nr:hypothetical protein [Bdellovibrionales bacterium]
MTIHILEIDETFDSAKLQKLARRCAMTGGFELVLKEKLTVDQLELLATRFHESLKVHVGTQSQLRASNLYRALKLIKNHSSATPELLNRLTTIK